MSQQHNTPEPGKDPKASLTFAASQRFVRPMQREITALINAYHSAVADRDAEAKKRIRSSILDKLDEFDRTNGDGHQYPNWVRPVMRANAHAAFGELEDAIRFELRGAEHAEIDMHKAISANNLSDHYRRRGDHARAIEQAERAFRLWPENEGIIVNLAMALYHAGRKRDAGRMVEKLAALGDVSDPRNVLAAHLRFEEELREMGDLPEVRSLIGRVGKEMEPE
ncbi:MAG: tetratricopeptide repeat protein [Phycisphaeraceae bacterium]|nr:tetratricopeptide repeat protein [Phycisphaerales bacterium]MCB9842398.1 tetratricopeptide repeat protein [Phycisphaeraceae bacterium]